MPETVDFVLKRIKAIRKSKRRSIHDCATILGISKETYHDIEKCTIQLTLPELELLAIYLGENPADLMNSKHSSLANSAFLSEDLRPQFMNIREKMVRALIAMQRKQRSVTLEDMHLATHITLEKLEAYDDGTLPIPIDDLIKMCSFLEISLDSLHEPIWPTRAEPDKNRPHADWQPEYHSSESKGTPDHEEPYSDILKALKKVPKQDQAFIAKYLIEKIRSM